MKENNYFVENIFPTPLYINFLTGQKLDIVQKEIKDKLDKVNFLKKDEWGDTHYLSSTKFNECIIQKLKLINFKNFLKDNLKKYCEYIKFEFKEYSCISWITLFKKNDYGHVHCHGNSDISGVYYFNTNEIDGDLFFHNPNPCMEVVKCFSHIDSSWKHKPQIGKLILFPGFLKHGINRNTTDSERVSLSFNITFKS